MEKPDLLATIQEVILSNLPPEGFKPNNTDIQKIVQICDDSKFVSSNRSTFSRQIKQIVTEIIGRDKP
ncbi:MAG: hypothetical protein VYB50_04560 [Candidatus Thermoplasmatota archaeon]|nr:hypothetical protein [Candidatus Thermoplasmatota archaeon]